MWNNNIKIIVVIQLLFFLLGAMGLKIRDAISEDSIASYDVFMTGVADTSFLSVDYNNTIITIYEYHGADETVIRSGEFAPSSLASSFFDQENQMATELGLLSNSTEAESTADAADLSKRGNICTRDEASAEQEENDGLEKRVSRCYQFCGTIANCVGNNGCPHCYAVRQGCLWQKWCR